MSKKIIRALTLFALALCLFLTGCKSSPMETGGSKAGAKGLKIVCTVFPVYDWAKRLTAGADGSEVILIGGNGTDIHSYQATARDLVDIAGCDLVIYVGGESDRWVEKAISSSSSGAASVNLIEELGSAVKTEELSEGMEDRDGGEEEEYDEHVWLSPENAVVLCSGIADALSSLDGENSGIYEKNLEGYLKELEELDSMYKEVISESSEKTLLFADRFPFLYLTEQYGLNYYAAFPGCSSDSQASFGTVVFLAEKLSELHLSCVLTTDGGESGIASSVIATSGEKGIKTLSLDSMQSVTKDELAEGKTYILTMEKNLSVIKEALN